MDAEGGRECFQNEIGNARVTITDCDGAYDEVVIPDEIEGLPVTSIGDEQLC